MKIAVCQDDVGDGPADVTTGRFGAAQLCGQYLAEALARRGHEVYRVTNFQSHGKVGDIIYVPWLHVGAYTFDAAIAMRHVWILRDVAATYKYAWVQDEFGHEGAGFEKYPEVKVVVPSDYLKPIVERVATVSAVIRLGAPASLLDIPIRYGRRVYTSGAWVECRGTLTAIEAVERVRKSFPNVTLALYGDEQLWGRLPGASEYGKRVRAAAGAANAIVRGTLGHAAMMQELADNDIFMHPTTAETCWVSGLEAAMAGKPIIYSPAGAAGEWGFHSMAPTDAALAGHLLAFVADPDMYLDAAVRNREIAQHHTWDKVAERWEALIGKA